MEDWLVDYRNRAGFPVEFTLVVASGATIADLVDKALYKLSEFRYDLVIFMGGVNDLTHKPRGRKARPVFTDVDNLVDVMYSKLEWAHHVLSRWCNLVAIGLLTGLDLEVYNRRFRGIERDYSQAQEIINEGMITLNKAIASLNESSGAISPRILDTIHNRVRTTYYHKYFKFRDGLHPTPKLLAKWAFKIVAAMGSNFGFHYPPCLTYWPECIFQTAF